MTTPLSPAAQAVIGAAHRQPFMDADGRPNFAGAVAAALLAVADQVVPKEDLPQVDEESVLDHLQYGYIHSRQQSRDSILAIATELRGEGEG